VVVFAADPFFGSPLFSGNLFIDELAPSPSPPVTPFSPRVPAFFLVVIPFSSGADLILVSNDFRGDVIRSPRPPRRRTLSFLVPSRRYLPPFLRT